LAACKCGCSNHVVDPQQQALQELLQKFKGYKGAIIPVLQGAQDIYGYLPKEVMQQIAKELRVPFSKIYGVVTFYAQFHLKPRGRNIVRVCQGTACHVRGGKKIFEAVEKSLGIHEGETTEDLRFTLETVACLGACGLAPVLMINDDTHGRLIPGDIIGILEQYE